MALDIGLSVGESFVEFVGSVSEAGSSVSPQRFYLNRRSLTDSLKDYLGERAGEGGTITVATSLGGYALAKRIGSAPAFLVTAGFEPWLALQQPLAAPVQRLFPERQTLPVPEDHIFSLSERIRADGTVEQALSDEDLQFLAAKLELLKTRTIAVGLLHSKSNPAHEKRIFDFFSEKGFRIYCSHLFDGVEWERWQKACSAAYVWSALAEQKEQLEIAVKDLGPWKIQFLDSQEGSAKINAEPGSGSDFGGFQALLQTTDAPQILHLGIERFFWLKKGEKPRMLGVQPHTAIQRTVWPFAVFGDTPPGFEPGPMAFGKSQQATAFDVLFVMNRLEPVEALTPLLNEKARARILEVLYTLSKDIPSKSRVEAAMVAQDLETAMIERIQQDSLMLADPKKEILLTGALARSLHPRLEKRRPDLKLRLDKNAEFAIANASLNFAQSTAGAHA